MTHRTGDGATLDSCLEAANGVLGEEALPALASELQAALPALEGGLDLTVPEVRAGQMPKPPPHFEALCSGRFSNSAAQLRTWFRYGSDMILELCSSTSDVR